MDITMIYPMTTGVFSPKRVRFREGGGGAVGRWLTIYAVHSVNLGSHL